MARGRKRTRTPTKKKTTKKTPKRTTSAQSKYRSYVRSRMQDYKKRYPGMRPQNIMKQIGQEWRSKEEAKAPAKRVRPKATPAMSSRTRRVVSAVNNMKKRKR